MIITNEIRYWAAMCRSVHQMIRRKQLPGYQYPGHAINQLPGFQKFALSDRGLKVATGLDDPEINEMINSFGKAFDDAG